MPDLKIYRKFSRDGIKVTIMIEGRHSKGCRMKPLLLKRGDVMREYGVKKSLMEAIERSRALPTVKIKGYKCRIYRRQDVEAFVFGQKDPTSLQSA